MEPVLLPSIMKNPYGFPSVASKSCSFVATEYCKSTTLLDILFSLVNHPTKWPQFLSRLATKEFRFRKDLMRNVNDCWLMADDENTKINVRCCEPHSFSVPVQKAQIMRRIVEINRLDLLWIVIERGTYMIHLILKILTYQIPPNMTISKTFPIYVTMPDALTL